MQLPSVQKPEPIWEGLVAMNEAIKKICPWEKILIINDDHAVINNKNFYYHTITEEVQHEMKTLIAAKMATYGCHFGFFEDFNSYLEPILKTYQRWGNIWLKIARFSFNSV